MSLYWRKYSLRSFLFPFLVICSTLLVICILHIPTLLAWKNTPPHQVFSGQVSWFDPWDINVYVSAIRWGQTNKFFLENLYTTTQGAPALIYPLYTFLGNVCNSVPPFLIFQLTAVGASLMLFVVLLWFGSRFHLTKSHSLLSALIASLGGGLGWLFLNVTQSADLGITSFTLHSAYQRPHEAVGVMLLLASLALMFEFVLKGGKKLLIATSFILCLQVLFYPYLILISLLTPVVYVVVAHRNWKHIGFILLSGTLPLLLASVYALHLSHSGFAAVASQQLERITLLELLLGYGMLLPLAAITTHQAYKHRKPASLYLATWLIISLLLSFLPLGIARFFLRGSFVAVAILALEGLSHLIARVPNAKGMAATLGIVFFLPSSLLIFYFRLTAPYMQNQQWIYYPPETTFFLQVFERHTTARILAPYELANWLPTQFPVQTYFGHFIQTPQGEEKFHWQNQLFAGTISQDVIYKHLEQENISYVILPTTLPLAINPPPVLKPVSQGIYYSLYSVSLSGNSP